jgi:hypothetical protein
MKEKSISLDDVLFHEAAVIREWKTRASGDGLVPSLAMVIGLDKA